MQKSNVVSFLAGVVLTASVFYSLGISGVGDGGQGFIFKRPTGDSTNNDGPVLVENDNYDGQMIDEVAPVPTPANPPARQNPVQRAPQKGLGGAVVNLPQVEVNIPEAAPNRSNLVNRLATQLTTLDTLHRTYFVKRSWLVTDFCDVSNADAKRTRVLNSLNTIDTSLRTARPLMSIADLEDSRNLESVRSAISSISLSLMNLEEVVNGVPTACLSPFWKYVAFPEVSESVIADLKTAGEWNREWAERIVDLAYTERTRSVPNETIGQSINDAFLALDEAF
ncbi:hypothetical protein KA119_02255 [Candidatus Gracilibacteria bacterium]|nr:hypothetical protein [Candidatus Gracilibacteria bacterium]